MKKLLSVFIMLFTLTACSVEPSKVTNTSKYAEKLSYFKDSYGLCYAIVASRKTGQANQTGLAMTSVPCNKVGK